MLADPQSITIASNTLTLPRKLTGTDLGQFRDSDNRIEVQTSAQKNGRVRTVVRLVQQKVTTDPLVSTTNVVVGDTIALTINRPSAGYSDADVLAQVKGMIAWLTASSDAVLKKIIAGEN